MDKKRILIVTQELEPYFGEGGMAKTVRDLIGKSQSSGLDVRILMPRYGNINERRHRLHEVVRLSGINIIIDDDDYPLIIKVASLPGARLQVYFLDNEDFFKQKTDLIGEDGTSDGDNVSRMVFFCRGVLETVKKFGWAPDLIHCHGWITSLVPMFIKTAYKKDPIFEDSKVIFSAYENAFKGLLSEGFESKAKINRVSQEDLIPYGTGTNTELQSGAIDYSDAIIEAAATLDKEVAKKIEATDKPKLEFPGEEEFLEAYMEFFTTLIGE